MMYLGANVGYLSMLSPLSSVVMLIYAIHNYFIIRKLYKMEEFASPMDRYYDKKSTMIDRCRNCIQIFLSIFATAAIVTVVIVLVYILGVE
jgi:hypothetical protein